MNIFVSDPDPVISARALDDRRLNKMILETMQLFAYAAGNLAVPESLWPATNDGRPYKFSKSHSKHPCCLWMCESRENAQWTVDHLAGLINEYEKRTGKMSSARPNLEKCRRLIEFFPNTPATPFRNCTFYKNVEDVHTAYKLQLSEKFWLGLNSGKKNTEPKWTNSARPEWSVAIANHWSGEWSSNIDSIRERNFKNWNI